MYTHVCAQCVPYMCRTCSVHVQNVFRTCAECVLIPCTHIGSVVVWLVNLSLSLSLTLSLSLSHTHTHICTRTCTHTHTHKRIHTHTYIHAHKYKHTHTHTLTLTHAHVHTHTLTPHIHTHTRTHSHTHTHTPIHTLAHMHTHTHEYTHTHGQTYVWCMHCTYLHLMIAPMQMLVDCAHANACGQGQARPAGGLWPRPRPRAWRPGFTISGVALNRWEGARIANGFFRKHKLTVHEQVCNEKRWREKTKWRIRRSSRAIFRTGWANRQNKNKGVKKEIAPESTARLGVPDSCSPSVFSQQCHD